MKKNNKNIMSHEVCTGCSCCLLSCPVWTRTKNRSLTAQGRNKALQAGAGIEEIAPAIDACLLCGTCEQNCPEGNDIVGLTIEHRRLLNETRKIHPSWYPKTTLQKATVTSQTYNGKILIANSALKADTSLCEAVIRLLGKEAVLASDDGSDILGLTEAGLPVDKARLNEFIRPLKNAAQLIVAEGGLHRHLKQWLPKTRITGLGAALLGIDSVRRSLGPQDLYIIESRGYHFDYAGLVKFYDALRLETGAQLNLDLQRLAIPTGTSSLQAIENPESAGCIEQVKWILHGRKIKRIIVESVADMAAFKRATEIPVVHLAKLAGR